MLRLECWGPYACFTRLELKSERVTYDMMTPSAARGIVEALYWHPNVKYVIDRIDLLSHIQLINLRRNEFKTKLNGKAEINKAKAGEPIYKSLSRERTQRAAIILSKVHYCIHYHFVLKQNDTQEMRDKVTAIINKRGHKGKCYTQPYLGCREYPAYFKLLRPEDVVTPIDETRDLGYMLYDLDYSDKEHNTPMFFRASLNHGIMNLRNVEVIK